MNFSDFAVLANTAELSLSEKGIASAKVVLTGFVVVFAVLILLIFIIKIYGGIVTKAQQTGNKKKKVVEKQEVKPVPSSPVTVAPASVAQDGVSEEVVAVISAAVATMYGSPEKARIKSIKKSSGGRSAWANAGLLDNTRPF
ncbi:MAG: OadG family protein [Ruminococcus sp.]|nr:OadG family protein [Ruminococcus sp.]